MKTPSVLGNRIKSLRELLGMKQSEFAAKVGISPALCSKYETGLLDVSTETLTKICKATGVSSDFLLGLSFDSEPFKIETRMDYIMLTAPDGLQRMYTIPPNLTPRVYALLAAGFPEIMRE